MDSAGLSQARPAEQRRVEDSKGVRLSQVHPETDETNTDIDIIAIHGLDTKSPDTWIWKPQDPNGSRDGKSSRVSEVNWLTDPRMLLAVVGPARIFTSDWPASLFVNQDTIQMTIKELARGLLLSIQSERHEKKDRPILFIASCLGGIILIQALVIAAKQNGDYHSLWRATRGIVFLATPFRGTAFQDIAGVAVTLMEGYATLTRRSVTKLLDSVKESTQFLEELVGEFTYEYQQRDACQIAIFYEKQKSNLLRKGLPPWLADRLREPKLLVDSSSARLDIVLDPIALDRTHVLMNKFSGPGDREYCAVTGKIKMILRCIRTNSVLDEADAWIFDKHYTPDRLKIERLSGEQLSMDQCYINLAIVEQPGRDTACSEEGSENRGTPPQSSPFSLCARLKTETPDKNIQVELPTLFNPRKGRDGHTTQPRRILIRGQAGVGKTTLCKKIVHDFKRGTWNDVFDRILWVPLRNLKTIENEPCNFEELFHREYFYQHPKHNELCLARQLWHALGGRTLFVLDGLDEVAQDLEYHKYKFEFFLELLNQPNVIITSRPSARLPDNIRIDLELETIGFYPDQRKAYIEKVFTDPVTGNTDSRTIGDIQSFLQHHQLMQDLVRIPIQLDALCYSWSEGSGSELVLETMTQLYEAIEHRLWKKDILRLKKNNNGEPVTHSHIQDSDPSEIEDLVKDEIYFLEGLAFTGLHNDVIDFKARHRRDIAKHFRPPATTSLVVKTLLPLSFLRTSDPSTKHSSRNYHFLHLTFQEYFAARYFVRQWTSGEQLTCLKLSSRQRGTMAKGAAEEFLQKEKYNARYDIFWRFVAGLLQADGGDAQLYRFFCTIEDQPRDILGPVHQRLVMHCLSEVVPSQETSNFNQLREDLEAQLKQWLLFECNFEFNEREYSQLAAEMEFPEPILEDVLQNESENVQMKILRALIARPKISPTIMRYITSCLGHNISESLKTAALEVFERPREDLLEEVLQGLLALLKGPDRYVRSRAARALSGQSALPEAVVQGLLALLKGPDPNVRSDAAWALSRQSALPEAVVQGLLALLKDPDRYVRSDAAWALSRQSALPEVVQGLLALLKDPDRYVRSDAARALSRQSALPEAVVQGLLALLKDPDRYVRSHAAWALSGQSALPEAVVQGLLALLKDPDRYVRSDAAWALSRQSALPEAVQGLLALLKDPDRYVRSDAARALSRQSALPEAVVQGLLALLKDPDPNV